MKTSSTQPASLPRQRYKPRRLSRADRSPLGIWFWEIDRVLLGLIAALIAFGLIGISAASPVTAQKLSTASETLLDQHFLIRQIMWVAIGVPIMLVISMLPRDQVRRMAIWGTGIFLALMFVVVIAGTTINGAQRWIGSGSMRLQPSEFLKPFFVVTLAWILSWRAQDADLPVLHLGFAATVLVAILLMMQPDLGQTIIFCSMFLVLALMSGLPIKRLFLAMGGGAALLVLAYFFYPVANQRINGWLFGSNDGGPDQVQLAHDTLVAGGLVGTGPGGGTEKFRLPEAHTDYIFSVIGEEFGLFACIAIAGVFLAIIMRVLVRLLDEEDPFTILAAAGLVTQLGGQAIINMAVNTQLFPSKGMTLPFISYGGSSLIALSIGMGMLLALTKRNPYLLRSPFVVKFGRNSAGAPPA
jgi:cell division protein FtsW